MWKNDIELTSNSSPSLFALLLNAYRVKISHDESHSPLPTATASIVSIRFASASTDSFSRLSCVKDRFPHTISDL